LNFRRKKNGQFKGSTQPDYVGKLNATNHQSHENGGGG
jgi:hypothetical protein